MKENSNYNSEEDKKIKTDPLADRVKELKIKELLARCAGELVASGTNPKLMEEIRKALSY
jgi:hypothetical protein